MSGAILETFIFTEILKSYWHNGKRPLLYYYRDKDKKEIDVILRDETFYPLEIKKTGSPNKSDTRHFLVLEQLRNPIGEGGVICFAETLLPIAKNISAIPVGLV